MMEMESLEELLERPYRFNVIVDPEIDGYVIDFPDLPGCLTQVDTIDEVSAAAKEIRELWIETAYDMGTAIPKQTYPEAYSGRFNVRLPKSLHRRLAERAADEGVSLNQLVVSLLSAGLERAETAARIDDFARRSRSRKRSQPWALMDSQNAQSVRQQKQIRSASRFSKFPTRQRVLEAHRSSKYHSNLNFRGVDFNEVTFIPLDKDAV